MCGSMVDIQSAGAKIRRRKKKIEEDRNHRVKILWPALYHRAAIKTRLFFKEYSQTQRVNDRNDLGAVSLATLVAILQVGKHILSATVE